VEGSVRGLSSDNIPVIYWNDWGKTKKFKHSSSSPGRNWKPGFFWPFDRKIRTDTINTRILVKTQKVALVSTSTSLIALHESGTPKFETSEVLSLHRWHFAGNFETGPRCFIAARESYDECIFCNHVNTFWRVKPLHQNKLTFVVPSTNTMPVKDVYEINIVLLHARARNN
jgi:hypothetical protein